jgi:hypothetical protein
VVTAGNGLGNWQTARGRLRQRQESLATVSFPVAEFGSSQKPFAELTVVSEVQEMFPCGGKPIDISAKRDYGFIGCH